MQARQGHLVQGHERKKEGKKERKKGHLVEGHVAAARLVGAGEACINGRSAQCDLHARAWWERGGEGALRVQKASSKPQVQSVLPAGLATCLCLRGEGSLGRQQAGGPAGWHDQEAKGTDAHLPKSTDNYLPTPFPLSTPATPLPAPGRPSPQSAPPLPANPHMPRLPHLAQLLSGQLLQTSGAVAHGHHALLMAAAAAVAAATALA